MDGTTRRFTLEETRSRLGAIVDAIGSTGYWPFRRTISYHIGINCDAITVQDDNLHVQRRGRTIAVAGLLGAPSPLSRLLRTGWQGLLHPRHARETADGQQPEIKWVDLLRSPRRPK